MIFINGFLLGLSTGIFCLFWCSPIFIPLLLAEGGDLRKSFSPLFKFISGRFLGYILFGALVGYAGLKIESELVEKINLGALLILASLLFLYGLGLLKKQKGLCNFFRKIKFPILAGFLTGINICPPFLLALTYVFDVGGLVKGILFFIGFFIATSFYFLPFLFLGLLKSKFLQKIAQVSAILAGAFFLIYGGRRFFFPSEEVGCPLANLYRADWAHFIIFCFLLALGSLALFSKKHFLRQNLGGLRNFIMFFSLIYFGFFLKNIFCPLLTFQNLFIVGGKIAAGLTTFLFFLLPIILALTIGNIYCVWVCPLGAFQEFILKIARLFKLPRVNIYYPKIKYFALAFIILFLIIIKRPIFCGIDPFGALFGRFVTPSSISLLIILIIASALLFRPWCHFICPYGTILKLLSKISLFKKEK